MASVNNNVFPGINSGKIGIQNNLIGSNVYYE